MRVTRKERYSDFSFSKKIYSHQGAEAHIHVLEFIPHFNINIKHD